MTYLELEKKQKNKKDNNPSFIESWQFALGIATLAITLVVGAYEIFATKEYVANAFSDLKELRETKTRARDEQLIEMKRDFNERMDRIETTLQRIDRNTKQ